MSNQAFGSMMANDIEIRVATAEDASDIAPLMYSAGPVAYDYCYNTAQHQSLEFLRWSCARGQGFHGWRSSQVATSDGRVVGAAGWYTSAEYNRLSRQTLLHIVRFFGWKSVHVLTNSMRMGRWIAPPASGMLYLAYCGVVPECRSRGIGHALLEHGLEMAQQTGCTRLCLDVAATNDRAQALYERFGFHVETVTAFSGPKRPGIEIPTAHRMIMQVA